MGARESLIPAQACALDSEEEQDGSSGTWAGVLAPLLPHFAAVVFSFLFQEMATILHALPSKTGGGYKGTTALQKSQSAGRAPRLNFHRWVAETSRGFRDHPGSEHSPEGQVCNHSGWS